MKKFSLLMAILLLATNIYAQEIFVMSEFEGLNTKLSPFVLPKTQADICENVRFDISLKALTKRDKTTVAYNAATSTDPLTGLFRFYKADTTMKTIITQNNSVQGCVDNTSVCTEILSLTFSDRRSTWLAWRDIAIGTDGYNQPIKYDGSSISATYVGSALAIDKGSGAGPNGTYNYKVTCYSASYESVFNQVSNNVDVSDNDITLTMIPICEDVILGEDTIGRKIYRSDDGGAGTYNLVPNTGTIADNTTVTIDDSETDAAVDIEAAYPAGDDTMTVPLGKLLLIHKNRLFIAGNPSYPSRLYYSEDGSHDVFYPDSYFNIRLSDGDTITDIFNLLGKLTISKNNSIQKLYTDEDDPDDWEISDPFSFIGCQAPYSAVSSPIGRIYLANNGVYRFNGQYSELISDAVTPEIRDISQSNFDNVWGELYKNMYFMTYTSKKSGSSTNNRILILDLLSEAYSIDILNIDILCNFNSGTDVEALFSGSSEEGKVYAHLDTLKQVVHNTHDDFAGTWDDMRYIPDSVASGAYTGDSQDPTLELAWTETIDEMAGTIDSVTGIIDRPDTDGTYVSQYLTIGADTFDKFFWNEVIPSIGGDVTFAIRVGATTADCAAASWSSEYSLPTGSDISGETADTVVQYRISIDTNDIEYTPVLTKSENYVVRLTYDVSGSSNESTIPLKWRSGWLDFKPAYSKVLTKLYVYYDWNVATEGTLNMTFENYEGETDTFAIDLFDNPQKYVDYFTDGAFLGNLFRIKIEENSLNPITINKIIVVFETEPFV